MKFTYDKKEESLECVAYIDRDGDLCMKDKGSIVDLVALGLGGAQTYKSVAFDPSNATHRFYPGDKVTIEF